VDIFGLDQALIERYESFARSFSEIHAPEIRAQIDAAYTDQRFWPEPLITINPHFEAGASVDQLVAQNVLDPALSKIFAAGSDRKPIKLHRHQERAVAKARNADANRVRTLVTRHTEGRQLGILGELTKLTPYSSLQDVLIFIALVGVLLVRPSGLPGKTSVEQVRCARPVEFGRDAKLSCRPRWWRRWQHRRSQYGRRQFRRAGHEGPLALG